MDCPILRKKIPREKNDTSKVLDISCLRFVDSKRKRSIVLLGLGRVAIRIKPSSSFRCRHQFMKTDQRVAFILSSVFNLKKLATESKANLSKVDKLLANLKAQTDHNE